MELIQNLVNVPHKTVEYDRGSGLHARWRSHCAIVHVTGVAGQSDSCADCERPVATAPTSQKCHTSGVNLEVTAIEGEEYMCFYPPAPVAASAHVRYGSKFTEGVFRPQTYRNLEWLQEDGQVTPFKWSGGVHEMLPWAAWLRAQV